MKEEKLRSETKKKKRIRSYPIIVLSIVYCLLFASMLGYICYYSYTNKQEFMNNKYNTRQQILTAKNKRGDILSRDGKVLATTELDAEGKEKRVYPYEKEFAHVVGYSTNGKSGIEEFANYYLINTSIELSEKAALDKAGQKYPGDNVITTLDTHLQEVAYNALASRKGAIIVTNPKTGEILAMVSKPDFDPNTIATEWDNMLKDTSGDAKLLNRATQGLYPPGSTFKIVTSIAYLTEHPTDYTQYRFSCNGRFAKGSDVISCYHGENHGNLDFYGSFAESCNSSYANIGLSVNQKTFNDTLDKLMFGQDLPVDFRYSKSSAEYTAGMSTADVMQLSIGQGTTAVSPLHINMITSAIANDGVLMKPYLISEVKCANGKVVDTFQEEKVKRLISSEEAGILRDMMEQVVLKGTASKLKGLSYTAAGKTGSAEFNSDSDSHAWFTGYAPADDPEICVTIIVENAGSGGSYAVPIAKRIFDAYFGVE